MGEEHIASQFLFRTTLPFQEFKFFNLRYSLKMAITKIIPAIFLFVVSLTSVSAFRRRRPVASCTGSATYNVTFLNLMTPSRFGSLIPPTGLVFSPVTVASHSSRVSILTVRGYASTDVRAIAETGDNAALVQTLGMLQQNNQGVNSFGAAPGGTMPGDSVTVTVDVNCTHPSISVIAMIAPSPDWIVQLSNVKMTSRRSGRFRYYRRGYLIAYDAGTDDGKDFTPPGDVSLDVPTVPQKNIAPLKEDETDPFEGRIVGRYRIKKIN